MPPRTRPGRAAASTPTEHGPRRTLGGLRPQEFLGRTWQESPRVFRRALPDFRDPLTPDELAGLACEPDVESRLVLERGGARPWQVIHGPQDPRRLRRLPRTHWTLLVQEADQHVPALQELLDLFTFVPRWRLDDVMVSFAPRHGGVGAHMDSYDVFLLQGAGRRRWEVDAQAREDYRPGLDVRLLKRFRPTRSWVLEPGDVLYVPPNLAHRGVSLEDAFTYSIGFRAPSHAEIVTGCVQRLVAGIAPHRRYLDPRLEVPGEPGEIGRRVLRRLRDIFAFELANFAAGPYAFERACGEMLTEPKNPASAAVPPRRRIDRAGVRARIAAGAALTRSPASRAAFVRHVADAADLFVDGRTVPLERGLAFAGPLLTDTRVVPAEKLRPHLRKGRFLDLLAELVNSGAFTFTS